MANGAAFTISTASGTTSAFNGVISGSGNLSRLSGGTTQLGGNSTYTGSTNIQNANSELMLEVANALPTGTTLTSAGSTATLQTLDLNGFNQQIGALSVTAVTTGSFVIQNSGTSVKTLSVNGTGTFAPANASTDTGTTTIKDGTGGIALEIIGGTLTFGGTAQTYTGGTTLSGGNITLNFAQLNSVAATSNMLAAAGNMTFAGGTLTGTGKASVANSQTFSNGIALNPGASAIVATTSGTGTMLFALNGIMRSPGSTIDFTLPAGTQSTANGITTTATNSSTILGGYATANGATTWATVSGGNIAPFTGYQTTIGAGNDVDLPTGTTTYGTVTPNSLRFNNPGSYTLTPSSGAVLTVNSGGILETAGVGANAVTIDSGGAGNLMRATARHLRQRHRSDRDSEQHRRRQ